MYLISHFAYIGIRPYDYETCTLVSMAIGGVCSTIREPGRSSVLHPIWGVTSAVDHRQVVPEDVRVCVDAGK